MKKQSSKLIIALSIILMTFSVKANEINTEIPSVNQAQVEKGKLIAKQREAVLKTAKQLIKAKNFKKAYNLLKKSEFENVENVEFNYQLGVASLRAGKYTDALYALDRVVSENKNHIGAQLDMAIAYYYLGNIPFAKKEFTRILKNYEKVAPKKVKKVISIYLAKIKKDTTPKTLSGSVSVTAGYSDNINSGYDGESVYIPLLNANTILSDQSRAQPAKFISAQASITKSKKINRSDDVNGTISLSKKAYDKHPELGQSNVLLSVTGSHKFNENTLKVTQSGNRSFLNGKRNYDVISTTAAIINRPNKSQSYKGTIKREKMIFANPASQANNSVKSSVMLSLSDMIFNKKVGISLGAGLSKTKMASDNSANGDSTERNINLSLKKGMFKGLASFSLGYQATRYALINAAFGEKRLDKSYSASIGFIKPIDKTRTINLVLGKRIKKSNIELYKNDTTTFSVSFRKSF